MLCASAYLPLLQFPSSVFNNFASIGHLHPWLGLFLGILFFLRNCDCFLNFLSVGLLLAYKNATDF